MITFLSKSEMKQDKVMYAWQTAYVNLCATVKMIKDDSVLFMDLESNSG